MKSRTSSSFGQFLPIAHGALPALLPRGAIITLARRGSDFMMWDPTAEPDRADRRCGFLCERVNDHHLLVAQLEIEDPQVLSQPRLAGYPRQRDNAILLGKPAHRTICAMLLR
jgi:hypothetical protein